VSILHRKVFVPRAGAFARGYGSAGPNVFAEGPVNLVREAVADRLGMGGQIQFAPSTAVFPKKVPTAFPLRRSHLFPKTKVIPLSTGASDSHQGTGRGALEGHAARFVLVVETWDAVALFVDASVEVTDAEAAGIAVL
jgi:hypothetical protein